MNRNHSASLVFAMLAFGVQSCASTAPYTRDHGQIGPLAVRAVNWNPTHVPIDSAVGVVDDGNQVIILSPDNTTLLRSGALVASTGERSFTTAAAIPAADGNGQWLVGVDKSAQLYRLRAGRDFERVSDRYGFGQHPISAVCALSGRGVAFLVDGQELALADGHQVTHYAVGPVQSLACGTARVALVSADSVRTFDSVTHKLRKFPIASVGAGFDSQGRLVIGTSSALYVEDKSGNLALRYYSKEGPIRSLATTAARVWFSAGNELGVLENDSVLLTRSAQLRSEKTRLFGSATGDVWLLSDGQLQRYGRDDSALQPAERWTQLIAPVFARSCTACHQPGGRSGIDLSTAAAWAGKRNLIRERVIDKRTMPPEGFSLSDSDRAAILNWLDSTP
jgi:hypothetical protein